VIAFLAALILLPGVTLGLKLGCTPVTEEKVTLVGVDAPGIIGVRRANGEVVRYHHRELYTLLCNGTISEGSILNLRFLDNDIIGWQPVDSEGTKR
jgi:hypothetical protein